MGLSQTERTEALAILGDQTKSKTERSRDFYSYLNDKGEDYGRLGLGVTENNTWQGKWANGFAESAAQNNGGGFEHGSQKWVDTNFRLAERHMQTYIDNQGETPGRSDIQQYHNAEYLFQGLNVNDWLPNKMLNESSDPDGLWVDWMRNDNPADVMQDAVLTAKAGGAIIIPPFFMVQAISDPQGLPEAMEFARNLHGGMTNVMSDPNVRRDFLKDLFGDAVGGILDDLYNVPSDVSGVPDDYGWALGNPDAIIGELAPWLQDALAPIDGEPGERPALSGGCPLIIDMDGGGIELISFENSSVYFDFLGNDVAVKMGWVGADDGFLVHDLNGDGQIESVEEMFGSKYGRSYLMTTIQEDIDDHNGFAALSVFDSNSDGQISALDTVWGDLQVWQDANSDGVTDAGELITLDGAGIESIDLAGVVTKLGEGPFAEEIEGHRVTHFSTVTMSDGAEREIVDAWLNTDLMDAYYAGDYTLDVRTLFLPTLRGYGQLPDLHIAMSLDNGAGGLLEQMQSFATSHTFEEMFGQFDAVRGEVEDILYAWAGIDEAAMRANPDFSDNGLYNLMPEYHFVRTFMGQNTEYVGTWFDRTGLMPRAIDGISAITESYQNLVDALTARLVFQSGGNALFDSGVSYSPFSDTFEGTFALSQTALDLLEAEATGHADLLGFWNGFAKYLDNTQEIINLTPAEVTMLETAVSDSSGGALGWGDVINTLSVNVMQAADGGDSVTGTAFDDEITGSYESDTLYGGDGDDVFIEDATPGPNNGISDDIYIGGKGNDTYIDGFGNDIFQYDYGDDVILLGHGGTDYQTTTDAIRFGAGITLEDVSFHLSEVLNNTPNGEFNTIKVAGRGTISIQDISANAYEIIDELHFDDGTIIDFSTFFATYHGDRHDNSFGVNVGQRWHMLGDAAIYGYEGNDQLTAGGMAAGRNVTMYGGSGDDTFAPLDANGVVYGGSGNDVALLGSGDDIYHYESGNDIIRTGGGGQNTITLPENVTLSDLNFYRYNDPRKGNPQILDAKIDVDGLGSISIWQQFIGTAYQIVQTLQFHDGSTAELADQSFLTIGTDGDDRFYGGYGWPNDDDTYLFSSGKDTISDSSGTDTLLFGPGITFSDLNIYRVAYAKTDTNIWRGNDLFIEDQNGNSMEIELYDLDYLSNDYALEHLKFSDGSVINLTDLEIEVHGTDAAENFYWVRKDASDDDTFFGYGGDDNLYGGEGNDILHGGAGDDDIDGGSGIDESVYQGYYADFSITADTYYTYVSDTVGNEGNDRLRKVETLRFADGTYDVASGVFTPALVNAAPVAEDDSAVTAQDTSVIIDVLSNDSDPDGDLLSVAQLGAALHGSVVQNANGTLTYTPDAGFSGADSFTYTVSDGVDTGGATVNITVQAATGGGDVNNALQTLVQNADYEGADAILAGLNAQEMGSLSGDTLSALLGAGIYLMSDSGNYLYNAGSYHSVHSLGGNDTIFGGTNNSRLFGGDGNDKLYDYRGGDDYLNGGDGDDYLSSGDGDDVLYGGDGADTLVGGAGADTFVFRQGDSGIDKIYMNIADADRLDVLDMLTGYDPAQNALGDFVQLTSDGFSTHVFVDADGQGPGNATEIAVLYGNSGVNIQDVIDTGSVVNANNSPVAVNDSVVTTKNTAKVIDILNNDSDPDGDPLSVTQLGAALHGSVTQNANGTLTYTPGANFSGADSFTYTISDGVDTDTASVFVQVTAVNAAPVAEDDSAVTAQDTSVIIDVLSNDSDPDGDPLSVTQSGAALHGSVTQNANGTLTYTPGANFSGADSFTYTISDGVDTGGATVNIDVQAATGGGGDVNNALQTLVQNADYEGADAILADLNAQEMDSLSGDTLSALLGAGIYLMSDSGDYLYNAGSYHSVHSLDGNDKMLGGTNNSRLFGGSGDDTLYDYRGGDDYLDGGSGNDTLSSGDGDDILYGGDGADTLVGGAGADTFVFRQGDSGIDKIYMNIADGDRLDVSDLISAYDPLSDAINDFVQITDNGANSTLSVDVDGGGDSFVQIASLAGVTGLTNEEALETSGILITV
ncbi:cadherin-like domain-containing protein [Nitrosomonas aestuarii]|uniref:cadherin-like domain-containing protein n=1 Tax=Nitrosomonas aestuarii TaxID=52441 RepID=UPI000D319B33|nr:Ig-like domain-containing protein [Nitrosomonas aestuarii]PTN12512.1 putative secreted protein (type I secretion substrate) [Nitrosomonas aestuarii]